MLQLAVDRKRRSAPVGDRGDGRPRLGGPQDAAAAVGAELAGRQRDRVDGDPAPAVEQVAQGSAGVGLGGAHGQVDGVDVGRQGGERVGPPRPRKRHRGERHELGAGFGDGRDVGLEVGLGEHVLAELAGAASGPVLRLEDDDGVALAGELVGGGQAAQTGADHGHAAGLFAARHRGRRRLLGMRHRRPLELVDADAAARLLAHAGRLAGGVAAARDHARERHGLGEGPARLGPVAAERRREHRPRVDVHRTGRHAGGRLVLDAQLLELQQPLLVHHASFGKANRPAPGLLPAPAARRAGRLTAAGASLATLSRPGCPPSWRPLPSRAEPAGAARGRRRRRGWR